MAVRAGRHYFSGVYVGTVAAVAAMAATLFCGSFSFFPIIAMY